MRAARFSTYGDPSVLHVEDAPEPHPGAGEVRVRTLAASVNPIDMLLRAGALEAVLPLELPAIPGRDAVGTVDEVGEGVTDAAPGDVVFGLGGIAVTTAELAVLSAYAAVPDGWSTAQAAAAGLASATALRGLDALADGDDLAALAGRTLLIEGASGAVGRAAAQFALASGATVIGTARESHLGALAALGVTATAYGSGLADRVAALAPDGVDLALHSAPSGSLGELVAIVGDAAHVVTFTDGEGAARLGARRVDAENDSTLLRRATAFARDGRYTPHVDRELPLADIAEAHRLAESGAGKIVVTIS